MDLEVLRKIGLSEGEIKVYSALLNLGVSTINNIHEKVAIDRRNIYDILNKLIEKGLVAYIDSNGKRTFNVSNPNKLISYIEEKESNLDSIKKEIVKMVPLAQKIYKSKRQEFTSETFKGANGIKAVWDDMLNYKKIRWIGSGNYVPDKFPAFFKNWNTERRRKHIKSYHLFRSDKRKELLKNVGFVKFLPEEFNGNPIVVCVYGDKVVNFLFGENLFAFVIKSEELAENYRKYHKYLWKIANP